MSNTQNYSHWMQDLAPIIGDVPINQIPIPGSHDSGTYSLDWRAVTQNLTIEQQLKMGIRYFDLRPRQQNRRFYIHHTLGTDNHIATYPAQGYPSGMDVNALIDGDGRPIIFAQMRKFLIDNPSEVLILRFQNFSDFSADNGDGTNDFNRLAGLANAYFYINPATHSGVACRLMPYTPVASGLNEVNELRNTFKDMTLNNLKRNNTRVIIFFARQEVEDALLNSATSFDFHQSNIWPTKTASNTDLLYEPYWGAKDSWVADDDPVSVEKTWYPYHVDNIHKWDGLGFYVLQSQMEELSASPPLTSSGYHSNYISEQAAEYTYYMDKDAQGNLISNNGRNADRYIEWMKAGMTLNVITFDFVEYGGLMSKIMAMYQSNRNYVKRQLHFSPPGQRPWKIYPRTMCPTATMNTNPWYTLIYDPSTFPYGEDGLIRPTNLSAPASYDFFTFIDNLAGQPNWMTSKGIISSLMAICGHKRDGTFQMGPTSPYYDPNVNTYVKP